MLGIPVPVVFDSPSITADGRYILLRSRGQGQYAMGDRAFLVDLREGKAVKQWQDDRFRDASFMAFGPSGRLLFQTPSGSFFEETGLDFPPTAQDDRFFADR